MLTVMQSRGLSEWLPADPEIDDCAFVCQANADSNSETINIDAVPVLPFLRLQDHFKNDRLGLSQVAVIENKIPIFRISPLARD